MLQDFSKVTEKVFNIVNYGNFRVIFADDYEVYESNTIAIMLTYDKHKTFDDNIAIFIPVEDNTTKDDEATPFPFSLFHQVVDEAKKRGEDVVFFNLILERINELTAQLLN